MIKYTLKCHDCEQECEAWFNSMSDYDKQKESGLIECPICNSKNIDKGIMAPAVKISGEKNCDPKQVLRQARKYIEQNFENVGDRFADEAIAIVQGKAQERDIYGKIDQAAEEKLVDQGVPYVKVPWVPKEDA